MDFSFIWLRNVASNSCVTAPAQDSLLSQSAYDPGDQRQQWYPDPTFGTNKVLHSRATSQVADVEAPDLRWAAHSP